MWNYFRCPWATFLQKFVHNSRTVGRVSRRRLHRLSRPILHADREHYWKFSKRPFFRIITQIPQFAGNIRYRAFFVNSSNSLDLQATSVMGVHQVPEFESSIKIQVAAFSENMSTNFAGNLGITRERWVGRAQRPLHPFSRPILHKKRAHLQKFSNCPILGKCP